MPFSVLSVLSVVQSSVVLLVFTWGAPLAARAGEAEGRLARLSVLRGGYPRAYFFRSAEGWAANRRITYERWEACFARLMGIEGKVLDEEVPGRAARNVDFFTRFKRAHPEQLVLLHYNGNARDPRYQTGKYFAGHWIYMNGARILADVPAGEGETDIRVDKPDLFRASIGRYREHNEDVGLCLVDGRGRPNWRESEQVELVSVDAKKKTIRVRRGCYGTTPRAFPRGSYAAAHAHEGPWGRRSNLMWFYNYSTKCPRDRDGRTCADVHAEELAARFVALPDGPGRAELAAFDGLEFDVLNHGHAGPRGGRGLDCDADGEIDSGVIDGVNTYGAGVVDFCRDLRARLGEDFLILADGMSVRSQRAFGILNGIESEGWPHLRDWEMRDWSGGMNRHLFWREFARAPAFSYVNHKFVTPSGRPGVTARPEVPWSTHRLVFAAAVFTDSAVCYAFPPPKESRDGRQELISIWDELRMGTERRLGWLGRPVAPAVRLAETRPDLIQGAADPFSEDILARLSGEGTRFAVRDGRLEVTSADAEDAEDAGARELRFRLRGVPCEGPDLFVSITARGEPMKGYPREVARLAWVGIAPPDGDLTRAESPATGMRLRGGTDAPLDGPLDMKTGASVSWRGPVKLGGETKPCYYVHPPYRAVKGLTFWERDVRVPARGRLAFYTGMGPKSPERSDGVTFRVLLAERPSSDPGHRDADVPEAAWRKLFEHSQKSSQWVRHEVSLARWAGKLVRLRFVSDCGPRDNATTDHSHWGDAWVVGPRGRDGITRGTMHMTFAGGDDFASGFYFSEVRSETVDIEFTVEGSAPVYLSRITARAGPDVIVREFERGAVVANPSPRPYTFDLAALFPGRRFRRLRGSPGQDAETNDGSAVGGALTLGPKDALFLVDAGP